MWPFLHLKPSLIFVSRSLALAILLSFHRVYGDVVAFPCGHPDPQSLLYSVISMMADDSTTTSLDTEFSFFHRIAYILF